MNTQIYDEASEWLIELQTEEPSASLRERFAAWLRTSPEHVRAYLEVTCFWEDAERVDRRRSFDLDELMAAARAEHNLSSLDPGSGRNINAGASRGPWAQSERRLSRGLVRAIAASIAIVGVSAAGTQYWLKNWSGVHATQIGEQTTLALSDGTTVDLNADTRIRERFTDHERAVDLLEGQALFRVSKDPSRPFVVRSDSASVRAVGTQFDVHRRATGTTVTVLEGRVAVVPIGSSAGVAVLEANGESSRPAGVPRASTSASTRNGAPREILLSAGDQLDLPKDQRSALPGRANLQAVTAWKQQRLVFEFTNLRDAAEEFNRFNTRKLRVDTAGLEDFKVSGTFEALDPHSLDHFLYFLRDQGLTVTESGQDFRIAKTGSLDYP